MVTWGKTCRFPVSYGFDGGTFWSWCLFGFLVFFFCRWRTPGARRFRAASANGCAGYPATPNRIRRRRRSNGVATPLLHRRRRRPRLLLLLHQHNHHRSPPLSKIPAPDREPNRRQLRYPTSSDIRNHFNETRSAKCLFVCSEMDRVDVVMWSEKWPFTLSFYESSMKAILNVIFQPSTSTFF